MTSPIWRSVRPSASATSFAAAPFALALIATAIQAPVMAQPGPNKLDSVVVTATRSPMRLSNVLADMTVLTRAEIEKQAFGGIADLLRNNGCAEMVRNGGPGSNTSLFLRGADTRHTVVMIDGVRVDSQSTGGASWQALPLAQIERVEVLKGPASAIYGSDAVGGVVQIFTRKGNGAPQLDLGAGFGNLATRKLDAGIYGSAGIFDYSASFADERSDGFNATLDLPGSFGYVPDRDGYRNHNAKARLGAQFNAEQRLELMVLSSHADAQYDASKAKPNNDDHSIQDTKAANLSWNAQWLPALQTQLSFGQSSERYETKPSPYVSDTRIRNLALNGSYEFSKNNQLNFILERREDRLENSGLSQTATPGLDERNQKGIALGWLWNSGPASLQVHGRHDEDSQFGGVNTGTLAAGYRVTETLRLVGSVGNAFRAPTLYQRGSIYGPNLKQAGVKELEPEKGRNLEFGLKFASGEHELSATVYRNLVKDLIIFGEAGTCKSNFGCYQNVDEARLQGLSLQGSTQLGIFSLTGSLDLQNPINRKNEKLLARRSKQFGTLHADVNLGAWNLGAGVQASGQRFDDAANTKPLAGYEVFNLDAQFKLSRDLRLQFNLDNVLNKVYQTAGGYAQSPRTVFIGLRYSPSL
ncbi:TonB-dependent receptor plug domain-containing protein [Paucibacter sp. Y2R2-4]|uniref:TonB-dependent receptor plug domain-containing protein n=1 Tax=Paucibacter sp. Y2R2-4 TaxID=2893553 RepID=UPI0021E35E3F|nr:TonB-dependent receptor [Paucibacter sp. Y2R2-4]MCV2349898.1 TonB-dependent receptor [Paucibacter sp. Y2R2-4]